MVKVIKNKFRCNRQQRGISLLIHSMLLFALIFTVLSQTSLANDKSGSRSGLIKLPGSGGTVNGESASFSVNSNKGTSHFSLPLPSLPGRAGITPLLSLDYSQFNGDTGFGQGWQLSVPSIEISRELGIPASGLLPNGDFRRVLNFRGKDLIFVGKRRGVAMFELESSEQALRINYHSKAYKVPHAHSVKGIQPGFSQGFEVIYPDGRRQLFSGDLNVVEGESNQETRFPLTYEVAAHGESIRYDYAHHGGQSYLTDVWFAGGISHYQFELMTNPFPRLRYDNGVAQHVAKRYSKLVARVSGAIHAQFCFAYRGLASMAGTTRVVRTHGDCQAEAEKRLGDYLTTTSLTVQEQLIAVFRYGNDTRLTKNSLALPTAYFDYTAWDAARLANRDLVYPLPALAQSTHFRSENFELADLNHDGLVDVVRLNSNGTSSRFLALGEQENLFDAAEHWQVQRGSRSVSPNLRSDHYHFADLNGDTYVDLLEFYDNRAVVYLGQKGGGFGKGQTTNLSSDNSLGLKHFKDGKARWVDFNQDGRSDVLTTDAGTGEGRVLSLYINLSYQKSDGEWVFYLVPKHYQSPYSSSAFELSDKNVKIQDVNGDSLPDLLHLRPSGTANESGVCVYYNRGDVYNLSESDTLFGDQGFDDAGRCGEGGQFVALTGLYGVNTLNHLWLTDVNGDGIQDYAIPGRERDRIWVWLGLGNGHIVPTPIILPLNLALSFNPDDSSRSRVVDIDGDGQGEILFFDDAAPSEHRVIMLDFNRNANHQLIRSNLLTHVELDSGLRHDILYVTSTDERVRDQRLGRAVNPLHFPVVLAKQLISSYGVQGEKRTNVKVEELFYHEPFFNPREKQFNGFGEVATLIYGDDYVDQSHLQIQRYHTQGESPAAQALAGTLKEQHIFTLKADANYELLTQQNVAFDPAQPGVHSLSTATRQQTLPEGDQRIQSEHFEWEAAENSHHTHYVRMTGSTTRLYAEGTHSETRIQYSAFDQYNIPWLMEQSVKAVAGPHQITVPASTTIQTFDFSESRSELKSLGIINQPGLIFVERNGRLLSEIANTYGDNGLIASTETTVQIPLDIPVPDALADSWVNEEIIQVDYDYDTWGNPASVSDAYGEIERVRYDQQGVFTTDYYKAAVAGKRQHWSFRHEAGRLQTMTDPLGLETSFYYDTLGRKSKAITSVGGEHRFAYAQGHFGEPSLILSSLRRYADHDQTPGPRWIHNMSAYHADGTALATMEEADLADGGVGVRVTHYANYNRNQLKTFEWTPYTLKDIRLHDIFDGDSGIPEPTDTVGITTRYDALHRVLSMHYPSGKVDTYRYFPWGEQVTTRYPQGDKTVVKIQSAVQSSAGVVALIEQAGTQSAVHTTYFERDDLGHLAAIQLPGETTKRQLVHDNLGRLVYQQSPGLGERFYRHDQRGQLTHVQRVSANGQQSDIIESDYDNLGRLSTIWVNGQRYATYQYDQQPDSWQHTPLYGEAVSQPLGLPTEVTTFDPTGRYDYTERLAYDANARVILREVSLADKVFAEHVDYTLEGTPKRLLNPLGLEGIYQLGHDQRLQSVAIRLPGQVAEQPVIQHMTYSSKGQLTSILYREVEQRYAETRLRYDPATLQMTHIYSVFTDANGRPSPLQNLTLQLDGNHSILAIDDNIGQTSYGHVNRSASFQYNWKDELIAATRFGRQHHYDYTPAGSFTRNTEFGSGDLKVAPVNGMIPAGTTAQPYRFDGFGQLQQSPGIESTVFNALGQLVEVVTATQRVFFGYNASGERIYKIVEDKNRSQQKRSLYPMKSVAIEPNGEQSYIFVGESRLVRLEHATGEWFYYLKDHLGSSDIVMNAQGLPVEQMLYQAYGTELSPTDLSADWAAHTQRHGAALPRERTHHRFTGQYLDDETGLYYYGARYYDPKLGRFISPDPQFLDAPSTCLDSPRECNLYGYALNNPMKFVDPDGRVAKLVVGLGKVAYKAYKLYKATGKVSVKSLKKAGLDELIGVADDLNTIFSGKSSTLDKIGSVVDLVTGSEFSDGDLADLRIGSQKGKGLGKSKTKTQTQADGDVIKGLPKPGSLSNEATRKWYHRQLDAINSKIDSSLPLREQALQAFKLRNQVKLQAREFMADRAAAASLPAPKTLQNVVRKAYGQGLSGNDVWRYVLGGSQRSNSGVDKALGLKR